MIQTIFPEGFALAGEVLTILSVILLFKSCSYAFSAIIIATEKQAWRVIVQAIASFTNLILNLLFIPIYGIIGAAWVYAITEGMLLIGYILIALKGYFRFVNSIK